MGKVASTVSDVVGGAVDAVGSAVQGVGDIVTSVAAPIVNTVEQTIKSAMDNPVKTALVVAAIASGNPELVPYINAADAAAHGASLNQIATSYAVSSAGQAVGAEAGSYAPTEYAPLVSQTASGATQSALKGQDVIQGGLSGAVNAELNDAAKSISDQQFEDWAKQQAANTYENAPSPTEQDVLARDPSIQVQSPLDTVTTEKGPGYYDETTGAFIPSTTGNLQAPLTETSGTNVMPDTMDSLSSLSGTQEGVSGADLLAEEVGLPPEAYDPLATKSQIRKGLGILAQSALAKQAGQRRPGLPNVGVRTANIPAKTQVEQYGSPKLLAGNNLMGESTGDPYYLQQLRQLYGSLAPTEPQKTPASAQFASNTTGSPEPIAMAGGGLTDSSMTSENPFPIAATGLAKGPIIGGGQRKISQPAPLQQLKQNIVQPRMAHGGVMDKYAQALPAGHKPEFITGLTGYYASGKGTGQSDDIDAMLHDGDYVADADLVAALGDGSSKAGAEALEKFRRQVPHQQHAVGGQPVAAKIADGEYVFPASFVTAIGQGDNKAGAKILDKMREAIRAHKRSAPTTKIPPKAKSPLEYLKMVKG